MYKKIILSLLFLGCAGVPPVVDSSAGRSILGGVGKQAVKEIADAVTPHYHLIRTPFSVCTYDKDNQDFYCKIIPCKLNAVCTTTIERDEFLKSNPIILDYKSTLHIVQTIKTYCSTKDANCEQILGEYKDNKLVIVK